MWTTDQLLKASERPSAHLLYPSYQPWGEKSHWSAPDSTVAHWFYSLLFSFLPSLDTEHCVPQQNCFRMAPVHILYCTLHLGNRHFVSTNHLAHLQAHTHTHSPSHKPNTHWQIIKQNCFCTFTFSVAHTCLSACCHYRMRVKRFNTDLDSCNRWRKKKEMSNHQPRFRKKQKTIHFTRMLFCSRANFEPLLWCFRDMMYKTLIKSKEIMCTFIIKSNLSKVYNFLDPPPTPPFAHAALMLHFSLHVQLCHKTGLQSSLAQCKPTSILNSAYQRWTAM